MNTQVDAKGVVQACSQCGQLNRVLFARLGDATRCGKCKTELQPVSTPIEASNESVFEALTKSSNLPLLVDFWADWCGPCKMMAPELNKFAAQNAGRVAVAKVNTEVLPSVAQRFGINAIPTLALFIGGQEVGRVQGARSSAQLESFLAQTVPR
jgi:thioredoxin 2